MNKHVIRMVVFLVGIASMVGMTGCTSVYHVGMSDRTPANVGKIKLYSTDTVPFEYEELGYISLLVEGGLDTMFGPPSQDHVLDAFLREASKAGADAVLNFRIGFEYGPSYLVFPASYVATVSGTAAKIRRP